MHSGSNRRIFTDGAAASSHSGRSAEQTQEQTPGQTQEQTPAADAGQAADSGEQNAAAGPPPMQPQRP